MVLTLGAMLAQGGSADVLLAEFATSLEGRMASQRYNAELALERLRGVVIHPGETFSFNRVVGSFSRDAGYRKAPVSYNGQLVSSWGGGVCQSSTTLYNAALYAGLEVVERNRHRFAPSYIPPGRDAAVAYESIDLKLRNPHSFPVRIEGHADERRLILRFLARESTSERPKVVQDVQHVLQPQVFEMRTGPGGKSRIRNSGKAGYEVATYRVTGERRELLSIDSYPPMHRIVEYR